MIKNKKEPRLHDCENGAHALRLVLLQSHTWHKDVATFAATCKMAMRIIII